MSQFKKLLILFIITYVGSLYGSTNASNNGLGGLIPSQSHFPGCSNNDGYWFEQAGDDFVPQQTLAKSSLYLQGNQVIGQESGVHYAQGNIIAYKDNKTLTADWLIYNQKTSRAIGGNVVMTQQYNVMTGQWADYYFDLNSGIMKEATAKDYTNNMYLKGKEIKIFNKDQYEAESGFFTSCDPNSPAWHITSKSTNINYQDSEGVARNATFYVESIPIAYTPYFQFPLGKRKSGFLMPDIGGISGINGGVNYFLGTPYYWNMAPNYDMTIEPKLYSQDGFMVTDQYRYLTENGRGEIYTEQLPSDWQTGQYRYYWHLVDNHSIAKDWTAGYTYNNVSDNNYFVNFGNATSFADNINLQQSAYVRYKPFWGMFDTQVQGYQTLNPSGQPQSPAIYAALPQINFNVNPIPIANTWVNFNLNSQFTIFNSGPLLGGAFNPTGTPVSSLQDGTRVVVYPSLTLPLKKSWGYVTPKFGYSYTHYILSPYAQFYPLGASVDRALPITSVDSGLYFDRPLNWFGSSFIQTLEPRIYYLYVPQTNQANLPVFDTAVASPNLNQLFSENRFSGYDRINSANDITLGLTSRILNDNNGTELANWGVGYRYYLTQNNLIYGSYGQFPQLYQPTPNFITELANRWSQSISTAATFQYDTVFNNVDGYSVQLKYNPELHRVFNIKYNYQYNMPVFYYAWTPGQGYSPSYTENQQSIDTSLQWPLFSQKWLIDGRMNYDLTMGRILNTLGGLEYNGGCWSVAFVYQQFATNAASSNNSYNTYNAYTSAYYLQFTLGGLTSIGNGDATSNLRTNIPGYAPITQVH